MLKNASAFSYNSRFSIVKLRLFSLLTWPPFVNQTSLWSEGSPFITNENEMEGVARWRPPPVFGDWYRWLMYCRRWIFIYSVLTIVLWAIEISLSRERASPGLYKQLHIYYWIPWIQLYLAPLMIIMSPITPICLSKTAGYIIKRCDNGLYHSYLNPQHNRTIVLTFLFV